MGDILKFCLTQENPFSDPFDIQIHLLVELQISLLNIFPRKTIRFPFL